MPSKKTTSLESYPTHQLPPSPEPRRPLEISIFDESNPMAIINLVGPEFAKRMREIPDTYLGMTENAFFKKFRPAPVMNNIRLSFYLEAYAAQEEKRNMNMARVYGAFCSQEYFFSHLVKNDIFMSWLMIPPVAYEVLLEEAVYTGHQRWREILELPIVDDMGKVNTKVLDAIIKVTAILDMRSRGMYTQRHEIKSLNFNLAADAKKVGAQLTQLSMEELDKKIARLEGKAAQDIVVLPKEDGRGEE